MPDVLLEVEVGNNMLEAADVELRAAQAYQIRSRSNFRTDLTLRSLVGAATQMP